MKLSTPLLSLLVNFLLGVSWAFALIGASTLFFSLFDLGFPFALFGAFLGLLPGLFLVLLMEYFLLGQEKLNELRKQTRHLEELVSRPS